MLNPCSPIIRFANLLFEVASIESEYSQAVNYLLELSKKDLNPINRALYLTIGTSISRAETGTVGQIVWHCLRYQLEWGSFPISQIIHRLILLYSDQLISEPTYDDFYEQIITTRDPFCYWAIVLQAIEINIPLDDGRLLLLLPYLYYEIVTREQMFSALDELLDEVQGKEFVYFLSQAYAQLGLECSERVTQKMLDYDLPEPLYSIWQVHESRLKIQARINPKGLIPLLSYLGGDFKVFLVTIFWLLKAGVSKEDILVSRGVYSCLTGKEVGESVLRQLLVLSESQNAVLVDLAIIANRLLDRKKLPSPPVMSSLQVVLDETHIRNLHFCFQNAFLIAVLHAESQYICAERRLTLRRTPQLFGVYRALGWSCFNELYTVCKPGNFWEDFAYLLPLLKNTLVFVSLDPGAGLDEKDNIDRRSSASDALYDALWDGRIDGEPVPDIQSTRGFFCYKPTPIRPRDIELHSRDLNEKTQGCR